MLRTSDIVMVTIMVAAAAVTYSIKHSTENVLDEVHKLDAQIKLEEDTIDLLKADWALLTQPNRLAGLTQTFQGDLGLEPTDPTQIIQPNELPMMRPEPELPITAENETDMTTTGSVKP